LIVGPTIPITLEPKGDADEPACATARASSWLASQINLDRAITRHP